MVPPGESEPVTLNAIPAGFGTEEVRVGRIQTLANWFTSRTAERLLLEAVFTHAVLIVSLAVLFILNAGATALHSKWTPGDSPPAAHWATFVLSLLDSTEVVALRAIGVILLLLITIVLAVVSAKVIWRVLRSWSD